MSILEEFQRLKRSVENEQRVSDRASGALRLLLEQLEKDFSCKTVKEGEQLLYKLERQKISKERSLEEKVREASSKYQGKL